MPAPDPAGISVPFEIETERLILRCPRPGDGLEMNAAIRESIAELRPWMSFATPVPTVDETERFVIETFRAFEDKRGFGFRLVEKQTGAFAGNIGTHSFNWSVPACEIGYWVRTCCTGLGYASEATRALTVMVFNLLRMERVGIRCDSRNAASRRVAEKAGFRYEGTLRCDSRAPDGSLRDTLVFSMIRQKYESAGRERGI